MDILLRRVARFLFDEDGPTAVEYAFLLLLILLACLTTVVAIGQLTAASYEDSRDSIESAIEAGA